MKRKHSYVLSLLAGLILVSGCAYFNAFYLAKKSYRDGEYKRRLNEGETDTKATTDYRQAVKWAREVIDKYPDSKYVDDSMFIIAMSQYRQNDFVLARSQFDDILRKFPDSEYRDDSKYYKAMSYIGIEQYENAMIVLNELFDSDDPLMKSRAGLAFARIAEESENWDELLKSADTVLAMDPDKKEFIEATAYRGEALYRLDRFKECIETLEPLRSIKKVEIALRFKTTSRLAQSYAKIDNFDTALSYLSELENRGEFTPYHDEIRLEKGYIFDLQGNPDLAKETYSQMAADFPDSLASKEAWYRVGVLLLTDLSLANDAKDAFGKVGDPPPNISGRYFVDAKQKIANIDSLTAHLKRIDDYKDNPEELIKTRFSLGGLYTFMFDRPDSASTQYEIIMRDAPETEFAIMSDFYLRRFAAMDDGLLDPDVERTIAEEVIDKYPSSDFATTLRNYIGVEDTSPQVVALKKAEEARLGGASWEEYMPLYQEVADSFPETRSAYLARLNMAYYYEYDAGDSEHALELYRELADEEPSFISDQYVKTAREKLTYHDEETQLLKEIQEYIAGFERKSEEIREELAEMQQSTITAAVSSENGLSGLRKIRARNARIRSRYYSN